MTLNVLITAVLRRARACHHNSFAALPFLACALRPQRPSLALARAARGARPPPRPAAHRPRPVGDRQRLRHRAKHPNEIGIRGSMPGDRAQGRGPCASGSSTSDGDGWRYVTGRRLGLAPRAAPGGRRSSRAGPSSSSRRRRRSRCAASSASAGCATGRIVGRAASRSPRPATGHGGRRPGGLLGRHLLADRAGRPPRPGSRAANSRGSLVITPVTPSASSARIRAASSTVHT